MRQFMKTLFLCKRIITRVFFLWTVPCGIVCMEEKKTVAQYIVMKNKKIYIKITTSVGMGAAKSDDIRQEWPPQWQCLNSGT